jgi:hypothetical protein
MGASLGGVFCSHTFLYCGCGIVGYSACLFACRDTGCALGVLNWEGGVRFIEV